MTMHVRVAGRDDLTKVNELRRQVNDVHTAGEPGIFKQGFGEDLRAYIYKIYDDPAKSIIVAEDEGEICGFAVLLRFNKPESPYSRERRYLNVEEFGVDEAHRRKGVGRELMRYIRDTAKAEGFDRVELDMWEFNQGALAFYEDMGFTTYRRYMKMDV
ncbi:MAG: GNAT family N-acetyltransferase [Oscillospiraceae bacterium]|nr:GNAT family N-acetyltransferase [Oscillospiraceae bacterium]